MRWNGDISGRALTVRPLAERRPLTARQREVLSLLARGHSAHEVAEIIGVSPQAVWNNAIYAEGRLRAGGRAEAIAIAVATGEIDAPADRLPALLEPLWAKLDGLRGSSGQPFFASSDARDSLREAVSGE